MAKAAAKPVPDEKRKRADLARELLTLRVTHAVAFDRMEAIKAELKRRADDGDGKFREDVAGIGYVSVSPGNPAHKVGEAATLVIPAWDLLTEKQQARHKESGLVVMQDIVKAAYYGRCDVKLFAPPQGAGK